MGVNKNNCKIKSIRARQVWDSRGRPTVEAEVLLNYNARGRAIAPAGASTGTGEAVDRRDGGEAFGGFGVKKALAAINEDIAPALKGLNAANQDAIDKALIELDGTADKSRLGGNAMIATSLAVAHAAAAAYKMALWQYLHEQENSGQAPFLPLPEIQIFGGGAHAGGRVDVQDYMVTATGAETYAQALEWTADVYRAASRLMAEEGRLHGVADEGGLWPDFDDNEQALDMLVRAIEAAGLKPGQDMAISLDIAASQFGSKGRYRLARDDRTLNSDELSGMLVDWVERYPIVAIEDPMAEGDKEGMVRFTWAVGKRVQVIGDDFLVTSVGRIRAAARDKACNAVLIKPNQVGTLSETKAALEAARKAGFGAIVSARSGETEDVSIVHLAVGWGVEQLKVGSITRAERTAKWNEGLRIADQLKEMGLEGEGQQPGGALPPRSRFPWGKGG
ncbi:MAG: phosphopyruvate hydratase [Alphaproteobacteria bacterium]|nr:phosphopyruvate hydratase [Alphaproteobacteria bacterium]